MDIEKEWLKLESAHPLPDQLEQPSALALNKAPSDTLSKLKKSIFLALWQGGVVCCLTAVVLLAAPFLEVRLCLLLVLGFFLWVLKNGWDVYRMINVDHFSSRPVLQEMEYYYAVFHRWISVQQKIGLFFYPFAIAAGFMLGAKASNPAILWTSPRLWIIFCVTLILLTQASYFLARWLTRASFGNYLLELKKNIETLKAV